MGDADPAVHGIMSFHFNEHARHGSWWFLCVMVLLLAGAPDQAMSRDGFASTADEGMVRYALVVTGGEVLEGVYPDAHTSFITRALLPLGCRCIVSLVVDDDPQDLREAIRFASARAELVIVTGGLGPTANDLTRETIAEYLDVELREEPELVALLECRFGQPPGQLRANVLRQALVPSGGSHLPNPHGTAAGLIFPGELPIVALPGPPRELQPMVRTSLIPYLEERFGVRPPGATVLLRFVGAGQSLISQTLDDHKLLPPDVTVGSIFEGGRVDFTFSKTGGSQSDREQLEELTAAIREHLGQYLYATNNSSLEDVVVDLFLARNASLVITELGSGGIVAATLQPGRNSGRLLTAMLATPTLLEMRKLVPLDGGLEKAIADPIERGRRIAREAAQHVEASWALAAVPDSASAGALPAMRIVLAMPEGRWATTALPPPATSPEGRFRFSTQLLDWLRRELIRDPRGWLP
jgi:molybdenum cofactor synthesis domain-containing protein